jgi:DNA-binding winged helix-turn-helix (wHTH) protein
MKPVSMGPQRFGSFEFDPVSGDLRKHRLAVRLTPLASELLRELLGTPLRIHSRQELQKHLWPEQPFLDFEHGLNKVVHSLRDALGDTGSNPRFIETVIGTGYRFKPEWLLSYSYAANRLKGSPAFSIAVLPIALLGTVSGHQFRSGRVTANLTDTLSAISGLRVMAQSIVGSHYTPGMSPQGAGAAMGVRAVLSGEVILHESALFLRMELIDVSDGAQLSVIRIDRPSRIEHSIEMDIADEIASHFRPVLASLSDPTALTD